MFRISSHCCNLHFDARFKGGIFQNLCNMREKKYCAPNWETFVDLTQTNVRTFGKLYSYFMLMIAEGISLDLAPS